jgi:hypothetical protein
MADLRVKRAREIQDAIGEILIHHWDPIGLADVPEATGEYDSYIGPVYRILAGSRSEQELTEFLFQTARDISGAPVLPGASADDLRPVARRLLELDVRLGGCA